MDEFYLYLYCGDSLATHANNHAGDFVVDLPKTYLLGRQWECALTEISLFTETEVSNLRLYFCADHVEETYVRNSFLPILRSFDTSEGYLDLEFTRPYYMGVRMGELNQVRISIRGDDLQPCRFKVDRVYCTLHLRRRKWGL